MSSSLWTLGMQHLSQKSSKELSHLCFLLHNANLIPLFSFNFFTISRNLDKEHLIQILMNQFSTSIRKLNTPFHHLKYFLHHDKKSFLMFLPIHYFTFR